MIPLRDAPKNARFALAVEIWMDYFKDGNLQQYIGKQNKELTDEYLDDIRIMLTHATLGLRYLHMRNYYHRDIKPANIVRHNERWALTDLGMIIRNNSTLRSQIKSKQGTPFAFSALLLLLYLHSSYYPVSL